MTFETSYDGHRPQCEERTHLPRSTHTPETRATRSRYNRVAPVYDLMEVLIEPRYSAWRERAWSLVEGPEVLELGVGTGKNTTYHLARLRIDGVDLSELMLARA